MVSSLLIGLLLVASAPSADDSMRAADQLAARGLHELGAYSLLQDLCGNVGNRLAGSENAAKAVVWGEQVMNRLGLENVHQMPCMVPHWVRGPVETAAVVGNPDESLTCCALGGSVGTPKEGIEAEVIEVHSLDECAKLGALAKGKFIFFNRPFDLSLTNTFAQYGGAADQRFQGAISAGKVGAIGALVHSMTTDMDDVPHTGAMGYSDGVIKVPGAALSAVASERLSKMLRADPHLKVRLTLSCETLPDVPSANVIGEIKGSEKPNEVIVMGGHLDSWDKGQGAHDDGAGVVQSLEALSLLRELGWKPKRTIRVVLFMNEEHGSEGADAYFAYAKSAKEKHIAAIESDSGGFAPRGFSCSLSPSRVKRLAKWIPALKRFEAEWISGGGGGGADVGPLAELKTVLFGLEPESQRYFDYHHSDKDTIDKVNPRELELGALSMAMLAWFISEEGV